jgi:hypothetical protein
MTIRSLYIAFDLETSNVMVGKNMDAHTPGISCAATMISGDNSPFLWVSPSPDNPKLDGTYSPLDQGSLERLVELLGRGRVCSWNGASFDFRTLYEELVNPGYKKRVVDACFDSIDPAFTMYCVKGYMAGLDSVKRAMIIPGKTEGMHGDMAPVEYDAGSTLEVVKAIEETGKISWITQRGMRSSFDIPTFGGSLLTVRESLGLTMENTSWMERVPRSPKELLSWTGQV